MPGAGPVLTGPGARQAGSQRITSSVCAISFMYIMCIIIYSTLSADIAARRPEGEHPPGCPETAVLDCTPGFGHESYASPFAHLQFRKSGTADLAGYTGMRERFIV